MGARCTSGLNMGSLSQVLCKQSATPLPTVRRRRRIGPCARRARALPPSMPTSEDKDTGKLRTAMEDEAPARRSPQSCTPCSLPEPTWSAALACCGGAASARPSFLRDLGAAPLDTLSTLYEYVLIRATISQKNGLRHRVRGSWACMPGRLQG